MRAQIADFSKYPEVDTFLEKVFENKEVRPEFIEDINEEILSELSFAMGAIGLSHVINMLINEIETKEDIEGLIGFSQIRHALLKTNASISYK